MIVSKTIKIGTRGSFLGLYQANSVKESLEKATRSTGLPFNFELIIIKTTGDKFTDRSLRDIGGKGLFTKEIDRALLNGSIELAVHSAKDCETSLPPDLEIAAMLKRDDPRDALISQDNQPIKDLPHQATLGTSSLRRASQALHMRPDLKITLLRGDVPSRLEKLSKKTMESAILAAAGLKRLNVLDKACEIFDPMTFTPAVGQGAIGIVCLKDNDELAPLLNSINHEETFNCVTLERAFLKEIDGHCHTPIGGFAKFQPKDKNICFIGNVATLDGKYIWREKIIYSYEQAEDEIRQLGKEMKVWLKKHGV